MIALADGRVRAYRGPLRLPPNPNIAASPMIKAILAEPSGHSTCVSTTDSATRLPA